MSHVGQCDHRGEVTAGGEVTVEGEVTTEGEVTARAMPTPQSREKEQSPCKSRRSGPPTPVPCRWRGQLWTVALCFLWACGLAWADRLQLRILRASGPPATARGVTISKGLLPPQPRAVQSCSHLWFWGSWTLLRTGLMSPVPAVLRAVLPCNDREWTWLECCLHACVCARVHVHARPCVRAHACACLCVYVPESEPLL